MPCVAKEDECYEQVIDDAHNPNEHQPTEARDSNHIKKLIEVSSTTIYNSARSENEVETMQHFVVHFVTKHIWVYIVICDLGV